MEVRGVRMITQTDAAGQEFSFPQPSPVETRELWHYTDSSGLIGILSNEKFWASSARMLNDSSEVEYGYKLFTDSVERFLAGGSGFAVEVLNEIKVVVEWVRENIDHNHVYVLCASKSRDELSQWRGYAGGSGYSIGLRVDVDEDQQLRVLAENPGFLHRTGRYVRPGWMSVIYEVEDQIALLDQLLLALAEYISESSDDPITKKEYCLGYLLGAIVCLKNPGFSVEREARFAFWIHTDRTDLVRIRANQVGLCPYLEIVAGPAETITNPNGEMREFVSTSTPRKLPITGVIVGPGPNQEAAKIGLHTALGAFNYGGVDVQLSRVPYR
jgi:hypothetical protein